MHDLFYGRPRISIVIGNTMGNSTKDETICQARFREFHYPRSCLIAQENPLTWDMKAG